MTQLVPGADLDHLTLTADLTGMDGTSSRLTECSLEKCVLDRAILDQARLISCTITDGHASEFSAVGSTWHDCSWSRMRLGAVQAGGAELVRLRVQDGRIDYLALRQASIVDLELDDCHIVELDLTDATISGIRTKAVTIGKLILRGAKLKDCDLTGMAWESIEGVDGLAGAQLTSDQVYDLAPHLARQLGIKIA